MIPSFKQVRNYLRLCPALMRHGGFSFGTDGELFRSGQAITDVDTLYRHLSEACRNLSNVQRSPFRQMEVAEKLLCRRQQGGPQ